ncbi:MAG: hypothetical protein R2773_00095 [Flavobacteriaceae bacterium]
MTLIFLEEVSLTEYPAGLENTKSHHLKMVEMASKKGNVVRKDGNVGKAFQKAAKVLERSYSCPFWHNTMEPV